MQPILGVDLGTTYTAAATSDARGQTEMVALGNRTAEIPSVLLLKADGEFLVGEPAERRAFGEPGRVARQFKRRLGDATPVLLGGTPFSAEALLARMLRHVVVRSSELRGTDFSSIVVCHPANYGPYRMELLAQAAKMAEAEDVRFVPEPVAAAVHYAAQAKLEPGEVVVVYDFGGGTFDVAVLRRAGDAFDVIGTPAGLEHLGGLDLDEAVFGHVVQSLGGAIENLDPEDPAALAAVGRLREECKAAKEALSSDTDTSVPVLLPGVQTEIRITRAEFEALILPNVLDTVATTTRAIRDAGLDAGDVGRILLVGGSARVPLVSQLLGEELGRPIVIDTHPKHAIALGAARAAAVLGDETPAPPPVAAGGPGGAVTDDRPVASDTRTGGNDEEHSDEAATAVTAATETAQPAGATVPPEAPTVPVFVPPAAGTGRRGIGRLAAWVGAGVAAVVMLGVFVAISGTGGGNGTTATTQPGPRTVELVVDGDQPFTDTDIDVERGQRVTIDATGEVAHAPGQVTGPDGNPDPNLDQFNVLSGTAHNSLIGKIGSAGDEFFVGTHHQFRAQTSGRLFLGINDVGVDNNTGAYSAIVRIEP